MVANNMQTPPSQGSAGAASSGNLMKIPKAPVPVPVVLEANTEGELVALKGSGGAITNKQFIHKNKENPDAPKTGLPASGWEWTQEILKTGWQQGGEYVHQGLDAGGALPVVGPAFDGLNGAIYAAEGNAAEAAISFGSAALDFVPGAGTIAKGAKYAAKGVRSAAKGVAKGATKVAERTGLRQAEKTAAKGLEKSVVENSGKGVARASERQTANSAEKKVARESEGDAAKKSKKDDGMKVEEQKKKKNEANKSCPKAGHPVNPVLGIKFLCEETELDFELPAILPLLWQRSYFSDQMGNGWLGQGWSLPFSRHLLRRQNEMLLTDEQGRELTFPLLQKGKRKFEQHQQLFFSREGEGRYSVIAKQERLRYVFSALTTGADDPDGSRATVFPLVAIVDAYDNHIRICYDESGLPSDIYDAGGRRLKLCFDTFSLPDGGEVVRLQSVSLLHRQGMEQLVRYTYSTAGDLSGVFDSRGNLCREYRYNNHILTGHSQPDGLICRYVYDEYTPKGKVVRHTTSLGQTWLFDYHPGETRVTDPLQRVTCYQYNADKAFTGFVDARGRAERVILDNAGRPVTYVMPGGRRSEYAYDFYGGVTAITDVAGNRTLMTYDSAHRLSAVTDALGNTTNYDYSHENQMRIVDASGNSKANIYDSRGLLTTVKYSEGVTHSLEYDTAGLLSAYTDCSGQTTRLTRDAKGKVKTLTYPDGSQTVYTNDERGNRSSVLFSEGFAEYYRYDSRGNKIARRDSLGAETTWHRDVDGLPLKRTNASGDRFHYQYDNARRLVSMRNENSATYLIRYDDDDNILCEQYFDGRQVGYRYNDIAQLSEKHEFGTSESLQEAGILTVFRRDELGQLVEKIAYCKERNTTSNTDFRYNAVGDLIETANAQGTISYEYDKLGRLIAETTSALGVSQTLKYSYTTEGKCSQILLPDGTSIDYLYYGSGHLLQVNVNGEVLCEMERDCMHREVIRTQGKVISHFKYNSLGLLIKQQVYRSSPDDGATPFISRSYQYDEAGNLQHIINLNGKKTSYRYDPQGRIIACNEETFFWDAAHNLIDESASEAGEKWRDNRIGTYRGMRFDYDIYGNLCEKRTEGGRKRLRWYYTPWHQPERIELVDGETKREVEYGYDAAGRRIYKKDEHGIVLFIWDGERLAAEKHADKTISYVYLPEEFIPLAQVVRQGKEEPEIYYYHNDHIGTPREVTSPAGDIVWQASYKAWGKVADLQVNHGPDDFSAFHQPLRFQGQYYDEESGLHYNRHRYYDPDIGRFITPDPIGIAGGENCYQYAPNPTGWIDPLGLVKEHTGFVYRALTAEQFLDALTGSDIIAKNPMADFSHKAHVGGPVEPGGDHLGGAGQETQFLSTSKSLARAECYDINPMDNSRYDRIAKIDLSKIPDEQIIDVSSGHGLKGSAQMWAKQDLEVLIKRRIPADAIQLL